MVSFVMVASRRGNLVWLNVMIEMQPVSMWHQKQRSLNKIKLFIDKFNINAITALLL